MKHAAPTTPAEPGGASLRILHVVPTYLPAVRYGGPIRSVHALAKGLVERGHEVHVYTSSMDGPDDLDVPLGVPVVRDGVRIHYFPVPMLRRLCWCPGLARALRATVDRFDVMHLHSVFLWPTSAAARIAHAAGLPYLLAPRGMLGETVIRARSRLIKSAWIRLFERRTLRRSAGLHVTTDLEAREIRALGLPDPGFFCVPNSIEWPVAPQPLASGPFAGIRTPYVLFLSRIDPKKGLDRLLQAWPMVPGMRLVIAGNDEQGYRRELERMVEALQLRDRVEFLGPVADAHKWALYEHAELFVLPSYSENFGNVVAEAMAMGCPVVVTAEVGLADLVAGVDAGVVSEGTPARLAGTIERLLADPARRRSMGDRGRATVRQRLSAAHVASDMERIYRQAAASRRVRSA